MKFHYWEKYPDSSGLNYCALCGLLSISTTLECKNGNVFENREIAIELKKINSKNKNKK